MSKKEHVIIDHKNKIIYHLDFAKPKSHRKKIKGGDVSDLATSGLQTIQSQVLYKIPVFGKFLKAIGDNATQVIDTIFGVHSNLLPSARARELGIDLFNDSDLITPDDPRYSELEKQGITDTDQVLYGIFQKKVADTGLSNYRKNFQIWAKQYPQFLDPSFQYKGRILAKLHGH